MIRNEQEPKLLNDREGIVLSARLGLVNGERASLKTVGEVINRSESTARRAQQSGLLKLSDPSLTKEDLCRELRRYTWPGILD